MEIKGGDLFEACTANSCSSSLVKLEAGCRCFLDIHGFQKLFEHIALKGRKYLLPNQFPRKLPFWITQNVDSLQ